MAKSKDPLRYPPEYHQILLRALREPIIVQGSRGFLQNLRFNLYAYRTALEHHKHPDAFAIGQLRFTISDNSLTGTSELLIASNSFNPEVKVLQQIVGTPEQQVEEFKRTEGQPQVLDPSTFQNKLQPAEDPMESALEKLGFFSGVKKK